MDVVCFAVAFWCGIVMICTLVNHCADTIELLLDGIIDRRDKLEKK